jgi:hypothetical protein
MSWADDPFTPEELGGARPTRERLAPRGVQVRPPVRPNPAPGFRASRIKSFIQGAGDAATFGYGDEIAAGLRTFIHGESYEEALKVTRGRNKVAADKHSGTHLAGQLVGGAMVPGGAGVKGVRGLVRFGAAQGAVYGSGAADGDLVDRLRGGAEGAVWGAGGGLVVGAAVIPLAKAGARGGRRFFTFVKEGRVPQVRSPVARAEAEVPGAAPAAPKIDEGDLLTPQELKGDPKDARRVLLERTNQLSEEQAVALVQRLEKAEIDGDLIDEPIYRSLLHVGLDDVGADQRTVLQAAHLLEEATEALVERAGGGTKTIEQLNGDAREVFDRGMTIPELAEHVEVSNKFVRSARVGQHVMTLAGVQLARAKDGLMPAVLKGEPGAREKLTATVVAAAQNHAMGQTIVSNAGRALRGLQGDMELGLDHIADDVLDLDDPKAIQVRIEEALAELNDDDLTDLFSRLKTTNDLTTIGAVLDDAAEAKAFAWHRRTRNSVSTWLRSNALSPATGLFNFASAIIHDYFRNDLSRTWAARQMLKAGNMPEAAKLELMAKAGRAVYWEAHRRGLQAMLDRIKWETWSGLEAISKVSWGSGKVLTKVSASKLAMARSGYQAPALRETPEGVRHTIMDGVDRTADWLGQLDEGGAFAAVWANAARLGAVTATAVDVLGQASVKFFTGAVDDYGRAFVRLKETYALAAEHAVDEGIAVGLSGDDLAVFVERRSAELADMPSAEIMSKVEQRLLRGEELDATERFLLSRDKAAEEEAVRVQFQDGPQTWAGQKSASFAEVVDRAAGMGLVEGVLLPYIRTPIRLFETGLVTYTPFGRAADEVKAVLAKGGTEAAVAQARMEIGTYAIGAGMLLGLTGILHVTNGGWDSTKGLDEAPPGSIKIGDAFLEIKRLDPFAITLSIGGMIGQLLREGVQDAEAYDVETGIETAMQIALAAGRDSFLEKSYLTGLRDLNEVLFGRTAESSGEKAAKIAASMTQRLIPLAGTNRMINDTARDSAPEEITWADKMLRAIPGAGMYLPVKRDILGDPVKSRELGISLGLSNVTDGEPLDDVKATLRALEIDLRNLRRTDPAGFGLTAKQLDELRRIRGQEATDASGATMREALGELFASEWFQELPEKDQKRQAVMDVIRDFNEPARALLEERDVNYAAKRIGYRSFLDYMEEGYSRDESRRGALEDVAAEGLPSPDL